MTRKALPLLIALLAGLAAPALADETRAEYWANSGPLPPEYAWDVTVTIATDGALVLKHCKGYATEGPGCKTRKARVAPEALQSIRDATIASGLIDRPAQSASDPIIGGGSSGGRVWIDGAEVLLPAQPHAADADRVATVRSAIRAAIPDRLAKRFIEGN